MRVTIPAAIAVAAAGAGCSRYPATPEAAYTRFSEAVWARDGRALWKAVDQKTRWAWMTVQRCHRESYDVVLSTFPEGEDRQRALRRYRNGALSESAADLFAKEVVDGMPLLDPLAVHRPRIEARGEGAAEVVLASGARVPLARGKDASWGMAGLLGDAKDREGRAIHDLEVARASGADYERAATRAQSQR